MEGKIRIPSGSGNANVNGCDCGWGDGGRGDPEIDCLRHVLSGELMLVLPTTTAEASRGPRDIQNMHMLTHKPRHTNARRP
jgi:hypothetical protein